MTAPNRLPVGWYVDTTDLDDLLTPDHEAEEARQDWADDAWVDDADLYTALRAQHDEEDQ